MASTPSSTQRTNRPVLDAQLNAALLDFAPKYMRDQLERLAQACDQRLEREVLPRLLAVLRDIDHERDAFEEHRRSAARDLRTHLNLLRFDAGAIDDAIGQLHAVSPRYFTILPSAASLSLPVSALASLSAPSTAASSDPAIDTLHANTAGQTIATPASTPEIPSHNAQYSATGAGPSTPSAKSLGLDSRARAQTIDKSFVVPCSPKRSRIDPGKEIDTPSKRQRTADENGVVEATQSKIERRVAFPNLKTGVDGGEMASKYWIREHLGAIPHTFIPTGSSRSTTQADEADDIVRKHQEIEEDFSPPLPKLRGSLPNLQSDGEEEHKKLRRTRRNISRPDYAEIVANKDPWNAPEIETDRMTKTGSITRSTASSKRRLTKPGIGSASGLTGPKK
ncbi:hypothetical protein ONZ43_g6189 [Nemania bipapillata]|uniref:Uncharacterized protein n=1 Tax=Nemania bipapillata TaxID=110536 RepID=A0ACC2I1K7_9PEZI|nr:hypothetical protein ONZ43_g6189 [Nemania bipapillata]